MVNSEQLSSQLMISLPFTLYFLPNAMRFATVVTLVYLVAKPTFLP